MPLDRNPDAVPLYRRRALGALVRSSLWGSAISVATSCPAVFTCRSRRRAVLCCPQRALSSALIGDASQQLWLGLGLAAHEDRHAAKLRSYHFSDDKGAEVLT